MNIVAITSIVPNGVVILLTAIVVMGGLIFYALRHMGEVRAEFSHGSTMFKLEAKDPRSIRKKRPPR